jgi:hypothetical protein
MMVVYILSTSRGKYRTIYTQDVPASKTKKTKVGDPVDPENPPRMP